MYIGQNNNINLALNDLSNYDAIPCCYTSNCSNSLSSLININSENNSSINQLTSCINKLAHCIGTVIRGCFGSDDTLNTQKTYSSDSSNNYNSSTTGEYSSIFDKLNSFISDLISSFSNSTLGQLINGVTNIVSTVKKFIG